MSPDTQFRKLHRLEGKTAAKSASTDSMHTHAYISVLSEIVRLGSKLAVCVG